MWWAAAVTSAVVLAAEPTTPTTEPSSHAVVFFNARTALREDRPAEVLKLWLIRNVLTQRGEASEHDADFRSVVWAALGRLSLCQDGFPEDDSGGAGLWPVALHNYLVTSFSKGPPVDRPSPWEAFEVKRQQRFISLNDVLTDEELRSATFFRTKCLRPQRAVVQLNQVRWLDMDDRLSVGLLMRDLLEESRKTLDANKVESTAVIDARIFDLDLALTEMMARRAKREARAASSEARSRGLSAEAAAELKDAVPRWPPESKQAQFLHKSLSWTPVDWLSLSPTRRLYLFSQARLVEGRTAEVRRLQLGIIDTLIERRRGEEVAQWIGFLEAAGSPALQAALSKGDRGQRLLELEPEATGFRERSVIALHRGVAFLEAGERQDALRSFAFALQRSDESREADVTRNLARRWLSYVLSQFETTQEVIATLRALVPKQEYNAVIEDLVWRAALRADKASFDRVASSAQRGGAFDARVDRLRPLAAGKPAELATQLRSTLEDEPHAVLTFLRHLLDNLEVENAEVRQANIPTLKLLIDVLGPLAENVDRRNSQTKQAVALTERAQAILDGLSELDITQTGKAKAMSPSREAYAGAIRLAPADPLPWPFKAPQPEAPPAFAPILLHPLEWRAQDGSLVFGWRITE